jgi:ferric-dicitrate binding protein FerR (iron transport regulator)
MNEIIARAVKGGASEEEVHALRAWRARSSANERHYYEVVHILLEAEEVMWHDVAELELPSVAEILSLGDIDEPVEPAPASRAGSRVVPAGWAAAAAMVVLVAAGIAGLMPGFQSAGDMPLQEATIPFGPREVVTGASETTIVRLGDGTVVRLAPNSRLLIPDALGPEGARQVWLSGRAFFAVTRDEGGRPFLIKSHAGDATVLGTRFDMQVAEDDLQVLVVEGVVRLNAQDPASGEVEVGASQRGSVSPLYAPSRDDLDENAIDAHLDWLGNFLVFEATPLHRVARELERRYGVPVRILEPSLEGETVRGMFLDQGIEDVVDVICRALSVHCIVTEASGVTFGL